MVDFNLKVNIKNLAKTNPKFCVTRSLIWYKIPESDLS